jgi:hypothetical protein
MNGFGRRDYWLLPLWLDHRSDNTLQVGDKRFTVLRDIKLHRLLPILFSTIAGHEIEGVITTSGEQNRGAYLSVVTPLGQSVGQMDELVNKLEKVWRVGHGDLSFK